MVINDHCLGSVDLRHNDVINGERSSRESKPGSVFRLVTVQRKEKDIINVNVHVYSPSIPVGSADCTIYTSGIGTHSVSQSHLLWGEFIRVYQHKSFIATRLSMCFDSISLFQASLFKELSSHCIDKTHYLFELLCVVDATILLCS